MGIINHFCNLTAWVRRLTTGECPVRESGLSPGLTALRLREVLDERAVANRLMREEHLLLGTLDADENFKYDVLALIGAERDHIHIQCVAEKFKIPGIKLQDALIFCNKWNSEKLFPTVYVDAIHNTFMTKYTVLLDKMNTTDFLREQVVDRGLATSWGFFVEAGSVFTDDHNIIERRN